MKKGYWGLWSILCLTFVIITIASFKESLTLELKTAPIVTTMTSPKAEERVERAEPLTDSAQVEGPRVDTRVLGDTASKTILFLGDSMLEGLSPRLAAYAEHNGHTLYSVIWYSSTSKIWAESDNVTKYIKEFNPDYIFISLGGNEMFIKDIIEKRRGYVEKILGEIGDIPYVWIGPPNWKADTGINDLVAMSVRKGGFFLSNGMTFERNSDHVHPTKASAAQWMDSIVRWMPANSFHPIKLDVPEKKSAKPAKVTVLQPVQ